MKYDPNKTFDEQVSIRRLLDRIWTWVLDRTAPVELVVPRQSAYHCRCPECGLTQMVELERECAACGALVNSWDDELPLVTPWTQQNREAEAAEFYRKRMSRWAAAKGAVRG